MDKKTEQFLNQGITPLELVKGTFKKEKPWKEEKEKLLAMSKDKKLLNRAQREKVKQLVDFNDRQGIYDQEELVMSEEGQKKISQYHEARIEKAIRTGKIKRFDPKKDKQAAWLMEQAKK